MTDIWVEDTAYWTGMTSDELEAAERRFTNHLRETQRLRWRLRSRLWAPQLLMLAVLAGVTAAAVTLPGWLGYVLVAATIGVIAIWISRNSGRQLAAELRDANDACETDVRTLATIRNYRRTAPPPI